MRRNHYRTGRRHSLGGGLLGLFGLLIGFRVVLAVLGIGVVVIGSVFAGLAAAFSGVLAGLGAALRSIAFNSEEAAGLVFGMIAGLSLYRWIKGRKERLADRAETVRETVEAKTVREIPESEYVEPQVYRTFNA